MKILILSTFDTNSGSALAAYRLQQGLQRIGTVSQMMVQAKYGDDPAVLAPVGLGNLTSKLWRFLDAMPLQLSVCQTVRQSRPAEFSVPWLPDRTLNRIAQVNPDLINLHWVNYNFLQIESFAKLRKPLVWTLHDMWGFTGGCHYSHNCLRYQDTCGSCPQIDSHQQQDLSRWIWQRKAKAWQSVDLTLVTPSHWLAKVAATSPLFRDRRIAVIPNGIDLQKYKPIDRRIARQILNLPQDKQLVLFGAINATSTHRKGFHLLQPALQRLGQSGWRERLELLIFGTSQVDRQLDLGFKVRCLGRLRDEISLALIYAAADVFVAPSVQENLPNTVMESIACGTPCVAFNIGGMPDMIEHQQNGYLAKPYEIDDLAKGIAWVLEDQERHQQLSDRAREKAAEFSLEIQARRYLSLFETVLASDRSSSIVPVPIPAGSTQPELIGKQP